MMLIKFERGRGVAVFVMLDNPDRVIHRRVEGWLGDGYPPGTFARAVLREGRNKIVLSWWMG
jgi:hypothetical protein